MTDAKKIRLMSDLIIDACDRNAKKVSNGTTLPPYLSLLGCHDKMKSVMKICYKVESSPKDCDKWFKAALQNYCKKDKSVEPCDLLNPTTPGAEIPRIGTAPPKTDFSTLLPTTITSTLEPTTASADPSILLFGMIAGIGVLFIACLVVTLMCMSEKKKPQCGGRPPKRPMKSKTDSGKKDNVESLPAEPRLFKDQVHFCVTLVDWIRERCLKDHPAGTCDWWIHLFLADYCDNAAEGAKIIYCEDFKTTVPPRITKPSTLPSTTTTTTTTTTTSKPSTEDMITNVIMFGTIGGSIFLLLVILVLYLLNRSRQLRREREEREAAMWGFNGMLYTKEDSESKGSGWGTGWTSTVKETTGTTKTKKDKKKKTKKTDASTKTDTSGTWL
ncbi:hypothetical protein GCK72_003517 [Caenorhabditis remanei]|uniref:Uncharacterized protein n=1 Tax=Caenorhabditis remanei TaxID=31234 RepID=A0A6A5HTZ5_CAERE|nr:hypothetical protein GCK72_003517 [Caenorhabditis remanei]KAF1771690.1 hypothetical protein GCK72_003517 [Caenorhabditis remanei]